jgi:hypothetical protein
MSDFQKKINDHIVKPSTRKDKKYDVFDKDNKKIVSFGAKNMSHYKDAIGYYSNLDHNDKKRRDNFRSRFKALYEKNKNNKNSAIYYSWNYLW